MNLKIEEIIKILEDETAIEIVKESEKCFKIGADRAALLFAFNSLMQALKSKLIKAGRPRDVTEGEWNSFYERLLNDDKTEKVILSEISNSSSKYFSIDEKLKNDMQYWISRRNACAHWKSSDDISSDLVNVFYSFYLHNIYRFQLGSSVEQTISDLCDIYDITKYRPGTSPEFVVRRINYSIKNEEFSTFLNLLSDRLAWNFNIETPLLEITQYMFLLLDEHKVSILTDKLRTNTEWASYFLEKYPRFFNYIYKTKEDFFEIIKVKSVSCCKLFLIFKNQGLFNKDSQDNDYEKFYNFIFDNRISIDEDSLYNDDFYNFVKSNLNKYLSNWSWLNDNSRCDNIINALVKKSPDLDICNIIINHFNKAYNSYYFLERFRYDISKSFNRDFLNIASQYQLKIPNNLLIILQINC